VFCQNSDISRDKDNGALVNPEGLAAIIWDLRMEGCHNINLVGGEPAIHLHTIIDAIRFVSRSKPSRDAFGQARWTKSDGFFPFRSGNKYYDYKERFNAPILWNSNFFISEKTMNLLRAVVDVWLPDFKFGNNKCARRLARTPWYFETISKNHKLIHDWGENYVIRHLVMPNHLECCTKPVLEWIAENLPGALVNIMAQYHPDAFANPASPDFNPRYSDISRYPHREEILEAYTHAQNLGINFEEITFEKSLQ
jgi:putative pyruvate formate lyase activating enzyme